MDTRICLAVNALLACQRVLLRTRLHDKVPRDHHDDSEEKLIRQFGYAAVTALVFLLLDWLNELAFIRPEHSNGINWVFLPAGIRLLATLFFGFAGFAGLLLASLCLNFHHFVFENEVHALSGAIAAAGGPYLAYLFAKHWSDLGRRLRGLTAGRLLFTGVLCGIISPAFSTTRSSGFMQDWRTGPRSPS